MKFKENLRKAGQKIADADRSYAKKVGDFIGGDPEKRDKGIRGFIRNTVAGVAESQYGDVKFDFPNEPTPRQKTYAKAAEVGIPTVGLGIRYGIPVAGVTLAGKGIMDLTAQFSSMGDQQTGSEIGMV